MGRGSARSQDRVSGFQLAQCNSSLSLFCFLWVVGVPDVFLAHYVILNINKMLHLFKKRLTSWYVV